VIKLGPNNDEAAREALQAWPGGLQVGGGISELNAEEWLRVGAEKVGERCSGGDIAHSVGHHHELVIPWWEI
jgi:hypothetical protein